MKQISEKRDFYTQPQTQAAAIILATAQATHGKCKHKPRICSGICAHIVRAWLILSSLLRNHRQTAGCDARMR